MRYNMSTRPIENKTSSSYQLKVFTHIRNLLCTTYSKRSRCNHESDCQDSSDEENCYLARTVKQVHSRSSPEEKQSNYKFS